MHFTASLNIVEFPTLLRRFVDVTSVRPWEKKLTYLEKLWERSLFARQLIAERYELEIGIWDLMRNPLLLTGAPSRNLLPEHYNAAGFIVGVALVHQRLSSRGKKRLAGMIRSGLDSDSTLSSVEHEIDMAIHLMSKGFDVAFSDIETGSGFDFRALRDGLTLEIECKTIGGDIGRKIPFSNFVKLAERLQSRLNTLLDSLSGGLILKVHVSGRLDREEKRQQAIADFICGKLLNENVTSEFASGELIRFDLANSPFGTSGQPGRARLEAFLSETLGRPDPSALLACRPSKAALLVCIESRDSDSVLTRIVRQLEDSARDQFSRDNPAALLVRLTDLNEEQLLDIAQHDSDKPSALKIATHQFLESESRRHIHTIGFSIRSSARTYRLPMPAQITSITSSSGRMFRFCNPFNPFCAAPGYDIL